MIADHVRLALDGISPSFREEWRLVCAKRLNAFFAGPEDTARALVGVLRHDFAKPVFEARRRQELLLPDAAHTGTLVCDDVATLDADSQRRLLNWLDGAGGRTQVISTASAPMLSMIATGRFEEALYYRLNTFFVDLTPFS